MSYWSSLMGAALAVISCVALAAYTLAPASENAYAMSAWAEAAGYPMLALRGGAALMALAMLAALWSVVIDAVRDRH